MTALLLAAAFACGAALPAMAEQATPETAAQPDPTEWADEAQDVTEAEEAPVYQQADAQEVATGETAASLTVTAADCTAQFIDEAYRLFLPVNTDMAALTIETGAELAAADAEGLTVDGTTVSGDFTNIETLNLTFTDGKAARVELYKSQLPSVSFTLNGVTLDEIQAGSKNVKYKGNSVTISQAGGSDLTDTDVEFKDRGNTTWTLDKRAYQFKLSSKAKVLGMDKAKTWLLIANRLDGFVPGGAAWHGIFCGADGVVGHRNGWYESGVDFWHFSIPQITGDSVHFLSGIVDYHDYFTSRLLLFCETAGS